MKRENIELKFLQSEFRGFVEHENFKWERMNEYLQTMTNLLTKVFNSLPRKVAEKILEEEKLNEGTILKVHRKN